MTQALSDLQDNSFIMFFTKNKSYTLTYLFFNFSLKVVSSKNRS